MVREHWVTGRDVPEYARGAMVYFYVLVTAFAAGGLVYWLTLRAGSEAQPAPADGDGFLPEPPSATETRAADQGLYVPITSDRRSWQTRLIGLVGLLILVSLAAVALAFSLFQLGSTVARVLADYAS
jgi:hypothetical protein